MSENLPYRLEKALKNSGAQPRLEARRRGSRGTMLSMRGFDSLGT